ncbi:MAG: 6-phosphogluconolactonase [Cyclobacteriaceae bacterium]|nr:6-phosphogluconolactonase [Cyclobacteriaceae bacterium]
MAGIKFKIHQSYQQMSEAAATFILEEIKHKPNLMLCPATGSTPVRTYDLLVAYCKKEMPDTSALRMVKLDEWGGLKPSDPGSCEYQVQRQLAGPLGINDYFGFNPKSIDAAAETQKAREYLNKKGPIDLCILGIGTNGHLGFNEPGEYISPFAHSVALTTESQGHDMVKHITNKPRYGITLGMADILASRKIILLANGIKKKHVMQKLKQEKITTRFPASFLWLHPDVTCFCDEEAFDDQ